MWPTDERFTGDPRRLGGRALATIVLSAMATSFASACRQDPVHYADSRWAIGVNGDRDLAVDSLVAEFVRMGSAVCVAAVRLRDCHRQ